MLFRNNEYRKNEKSLAIICQAFFISRISSNGKFKKIIYFGVLTRKIYERRSILKVKSKKFSSFYYKFS
ncbi:MAG: hypothetical protein DRI94_09995 [Bacteroidetes bacterium]|nr:MAG: hypothetical protein DRI94_09995 [Bacteroidota bacterium]